MKKLFIMLLTMLSCVVAVHAQDFEVDGISYNVTKAPDEDSPGEVQVTGGEIKEEIIIPETVTYNETTYTVTSIGSGAFSGRYNSNNFTRKYIIPETVKSIGDNAFYDNYYLEEVEFNEGLETIGAAAFAFNYELKEIRLPSSLLSIDDSGFLTNNYSEIPVYCTAATPPNIYSNAFEGRTTGSLHVVKTDVEVYQEAEYWKDFSTISGDILYRNRCYAPKISLDKDLLTMSCETEGATIYYTTDGSTPDENATRYTEPISYTNNLVICAIAIADGYENSAVRSYYDSEYIEQFVSFTDEQGINYTLKRANNGGFYYAVTGYTDELATEITIPAGLNGFPVTNIGGGTFAYCNGITSVTIPNSVTYIGSEAFYDCSNLKSVTIPNSVTYIGSKAFYDCSNLETVTIPVTDYSEFCNNKIVENFSCPIQLVDIEGNEISEYIIPEDVISIGSYAFRNCSGLTSITIPNSVTSIGVFAFANCSSLTSVTIPNSVTSIGNYAFFCCRALTSISIPNSVTSIGVSAFEYCSSLTSVTIPNSVTSIGNNAFWYCSGLTTVKMGKNVISIGEGAFCGCRGITSITIPNSVTDIGESAFRYCSDLSTVILGSGITVLKVGTFSDCSSLTTITIPDGVTILEDGEYTYGVFSGCSSLTSITIPNSMKHIGTAAFYGCSNMASVTIPNGVETIGDHAFANCALTSIDIPNSVTKIWGFAFQNNKNLTTAILGNGITEIEIATFQGCNALSSVIISDGVTSIGSQAFLNCAFTSIKLPESLTSLDEEAFRGCPLISIELPDAFTVIPEGLFQSNNFQYIKLGNNVKSIGKNAFGSYEPIIEIGTSTPPTLSADAFPNVEYLADINVIVPDAKAETAYRKKAVWEEMTFSNQNNIAEVDVDTPGDLSFELITECNMMPAKVVGLKVNGAINADDFNQMLVNMKSLLRLDLSDCEITEIPDEALAGKTQLQELTLPTTLQTIGQGAFQNCIYLKELTMQNGLQTIGANAFRDCTYLTGKLDLPSTVTTIGESAFVGTGYTSVTMPNALKTIGDYAFNNLPIEQSLTLPAKVSTVGAYAFAGTKITGLSMTDGVTSIGDYAFADTPIQGHLWIRDGITSLGEGAFKNTQISTVFLPNSIETLSRSLFQGCPNLNLVYVPDNFTAMSGSAFDGCTTLTTLRLSANLETMGEYALQGTPQEYIKVPSKVEVLPEGVFKNCKSLSSVSLPASLKSVEAEAFTGCTALRNLSVEAATPPTIRNRSAIRGINTDLCLISIPTSAYRAYVLAEYWGQFVQMRNDIAVETAGDGEIAFESVEEEEEDMEEEEVKSRVAARIRKRAPQLATAEESMTLANNGSSVYVPQQGKVRFYIIPGEGEELLSATLDGVDIMPDIVDNVYTATADKKNAKLVVKFSGQGSAVLAGDVNGDGTIDIADAIGIVNHILSKPSTTFVEAAADVNKDGRIDIADAIAVVNIILGKY